VPRRPPLAPADILDRAEEAAILAAQERVPVRAAGYSRAAPVPIVWRMHRTVSSIVLLLAACGATEAPQQFRACDRPAELVEANPAYPWTPNAVRLVSEELAPGVFAILDANADEYAPAGIPLATSGGFVIGEDGVLMVESMINRQLFCQADRPGPRSDRPARALRHQHQQPRRPQLRQRLPPGRRPDRPARAHRRVHRRPLRRGRRVHGGQLRHRPGHRRDRPRGTPTCASATTAGRSTSAASPSRPGYYGFAQTPGDLFVYVPEAQRPVDRQRLPRRGPRGAVVARRQRASRPRRRSPPSGLTARRRDRRPRPRPADAPRRHELPASTTSPR
jgi:hypothetical protein